MKDKDLHVKVMKAGRDLRLPKATNDGPAKIHVDKAAEWIVPQAIRIHAVSIPEQSEISIYADIEVSTAPEMYMTEGHIFRTKYAGPSIQKYPPAKISFAGSNITTTNIAFPSGVSILIKEKQTIYVHLDIINHSPYDIDHMTQDAYIYYTINDR